VLTSADGIEVVGEGATAADAVKIAQDRAPDVFLQISERTKAGLERARRRGARIGRPRLEEGLRSEITQRLADGATPFAMARALGIDRKTVLKYAGHVPHHNGNAEAVAADWQIRVERRALRELDRGERVPWHVHVTALSRSRRRASIRPRFASAQSQQRRATPQRRPLADRS
jgi:hypothetical protein